MYWVQALEKRMSWEIKAPYVDDAGILLLMKGKIFVGVHVRHVFSVLSLRFSLTFICVV
jgi:hypothetical protein